MEDSQQSYSSEPLRVLIIEDESIIAEMVKVMLEDLGHTVVAVAHNVKKAEEQIYKAKFNFAVVDINLQGGMEGIGIAEKLKSMLVPFLFLTSYADKYTVQKAKQTMPGAYVIKPFSEEDLYTGVEMATMHAKKQFKAEETINIKDGYGKRLLNLSEILYIKADNVHVEYHTTERVVLSRQGISKALTDLPQDKFIRIHKSYAVKKTSVTAFGKKSVQIGNITLPMSASFREDFEDEMTKS